MSKHDDAMRKLESTLRERNMQFKVCTHHPIGDDWDVIEHGSFPDYASALAAAEKLYGVEMAMVESRSFPGGRTRAQQGLRSPPA